jgi:hypothetical protein
MVIILLLRYAICLNVTRLMLVVNNSPVKTGIVELRKNRGVNNIG